MPLRPVSHLVRFRPRRLVWRPVPRADELPQSGTEFGVPPTSDRLGRLDVVSIGSRMCQWHSCRGHSFRCQRQWRRLLQSGHTQRDVVFSARRSLSGSGMSPCGNVEQAPSFLITYPRKNSSAHVIQRRLADSGQRRRPYPEFSPRMRDDAHPRCIAHVYGILLVAVLDFWQSEQTQGRRTRVLEVNVRWRA